MILKSKEPINEEYVKEAIEYILANNITNQVVFNTLRKQVADIEKIGYIEISEDLVLQELIAELLLDYKICKMGVLLEAIEEMLKADTPQKLNLIFQYLTHPQVTDKNMLFDGIEHLRNATGSSKVLAVFQVLMDEVGIESGQSTTYSKMLLDCTLPDDMEKILSDYEKAKAKYLNLKKLIRGTGIRELSTKINTISGNEEITLDDLISVVYHQK